MCRNSCLKATIFFLTGTFSLVASPALADVIPILLSQSVSGTESAVICIGGIFGTCYHNSSSFSASNSTPGPYSVSKSDQATATITGLGALGNPVTYSVTSSVQTDQSSDETNNSITVSMGTTSEIATGATGFLSPADGGDANGTSQYSFQFDLTTPSLVHLTGSGGASAFGIGLGLRQLQNVAFSLTGPGFDLDSTDPSSPVYFFCGGGFCGLPSSQSFDDGFSLAPGVYTFTAIADAQMTTSIALDDFTEEGLFLQLDFTPVPEPRWAATAVSLLLIIGCWTIRRKRSWLRRS